MPTWPRTTGVRAFVFGPKSGQLIVWSGRTGLMADFRIKVDVKAVQKQLSDLSARGIKDAMAFAINATGKRCISDLQSNMKDVFDRPTPFTLKGFYFKPAKASDLTGVILSRDKAPKGTPAGKYLAPQIFGGPRPMKKFEKALASISGGQYVVPASPIALDANGNLNRGFLTQVLSRLGVMSNESKNLSEKTRRRLAKQKKNARGQASEFFVAREKGNGRPRGIFKLVGKGHVEPVLWFLPRPPSYRKRFDPEQVVQQAVDKYAPGAIEAAVRGAITKGLGR